MEGIRSVEDYEMAQRRAAELLLQSPPFGSPAGKELIELGELICRYEKSAFPESMTHA